MKFRESIDMNRTLFNEWLECEILTLKNSDAPRTIIDSMEYSLIAGGKRLRPILMIEAYKLFGKDINEVKIPALAIEFIHTYSLIHDDLPAIDNDDYRRGKATNHKVYGEGMAILAGDALLNYAMEILIGNMDKSNTIEVGQLISRASGIFGMIGGQVIDIESENRNISADTLKELHEKKTGKLIEASILSGAILSNTTKKNIEKLNMYAKGIGLAFQITDDILDVTGTVEELGKSVGSDNKNKKVTYTSLFGIEKASIMAKNAIDMAEDAIKDLPNNEFFVDFGKYILDRKN